MLYQITENIPSSNKTKADKKAYMKKYREENKDKINATIKEYKKRVRERTRIRDREWYLKNQEKRNQKMKDYKTIEGIFSHWKRAARRRGKEWDLSINYIRQMPLTCYYTGIELTLGTDKSNTISLDRMDSSKGYIEGNVIFCCTMVNIAKGILSEEVFLKMCQDVSVNMSPRNP